MNDRYKTYIILMIIVFCLMTISAFANLVVYVIHWEQNETEWTEVRTYGQEHNVYIQFESSFRDVQTFHIPSEYAELLAVQIRQAAIDSNNHRHDPREIRYPEKD